MLNLLEGQPLVLQATKENHGERLDRFIAARLPESSRAYIQELIRSGSVSVNRQSRRKSSERLRPGDTIEIALRSRPAPTVAAEAIPLEVIYEDDDLAAIDKPAGLVVHPGAGQTQGTLVNALLHHFRALSSRGGALRPGIVHRLDRLTSGILLVAKNDFAHQRLAEQFQSRTVEKHYTALVHGLVQSEGGRIDAPIGRDRWRRVRMSARRRDGREARTEFAVVERFAAHEGGRRGPSYTLLDVRIYTGRTHQIRVHLSSIGHPVVGDRLYGAPVKLVGPGELEGFALGRQFLHASELKLQHPRSLAPIHLRSALAVELQVLLARIRAGVQPPP